MSSVEHSNVENPTQRVRVTSYCIIFVIIVENMSIETVVDGFWKTSDFIPRSSDFIPVSSDFIQYLMEERKSMLNPYVPLVNYHLVTIRCT